MNLFWHIAIHFILSVLTGLITWRIYRFFWISVFSGLISGLLVDLDHFFDYLLAFGWHFKLSYFLNGYQFLKSDRLYLLFHGWEYVIIFLSVSYFVKKTIFKAAFFGLAMGLLLHLSADVSIDKLPVSSYSILNRAERGFKLEKLVYPEHWQRHLMEKGTTKID